MKKIIGIVVAVASLALGCTFGLPMKLTKATWNMTQVL